MRYYLTTIQYNKVAEAENRTVPKAFDSLEDAVAEFHAQVGKDMKNETLGWSLNYITNSEGGHYDKYNEKWTREEPQPEPEPEEIIPEE